MKKKKKYYSTEKYIKIFNFSIEKVKTMKQFVWFFLRNCLENIFGK